MAIIMVTGLPGHGKTLWTLARLKPLAESENRPVFHATGLPQKDAPEGSFSGIPGLRIDGWQAQDPKLWYDLPAHSYMVIDECQRVFPIRARSSQVPKHVEELETHRHAGLDLYLITQHPMLVDTNVRKLVDRHFHVVRTFGLKRATVYEFPSGIQDSPEKNKGKLGVVRHEWRYPRKAFAWYKSAEAHTVKARVPLRVWLYGLVALLIPALIWLVWLRIGVHHGLGWSGGAAAAASTPAGVAAGAASGVVAADRRVSPHVADALTAAQYLELMRPRVVGLAFTAPAYDHLTKPVEAPYPSVCAFGDGFPCRCWSQRGFRLEVPKAMCEQLAREPMDPYWLRRGPHGLERPGEGGGFGGDGLQAGSGESDRLPLPLPAYAPSPAPAPVQVSSQ